MHLLFSRVHLQKKLPLFSWSDFNWVLFPSVESSPYESPQRARLYIDATSTTCIWGSQINRCETDHRMIQSSNAAADHRWLLRPSTLLPSSPGAASLPPFPPPSFSPSFSTSTNPAQLQQLWRPLNHPNCPVWVSGMLVRYFRNLLRNVKGPVSDLFIYLI